LNFFSFPCLRHAPLIYILPHLIILIIHYVLWSTSLRAFHYAVFFSLLVLPPS
jgi:hypothetical protein